LLRILALEGAQPSPPLLTLLLLALAVCQGVPFLLNRIWVYEVAIAFGYFCLSGAVFFLSRAIESRRAPAWLAASGLMFGLAIGCRPHPGLAPGVATAAVALYFVRKQRTGALLAFLAPLVAVGLAIATYNYQRFGNPFDFGVRYVLGNPTLSRTELEARWVLPGLYYFLICAPDLSPVFPWVRLAF